MLSKEAENQILMATLARYNIKAANLAPGLMGRVMGAAKGIGGAASQAFQHGRVGAGMGGNTAGAIGQGIMQGGKQFLNSQPVQQAGQAAMSFAQKNPHLVGGAAGATVGGMQGGMSGAATGAAIGAGGVAMGRRLR